MKTLSPVAEKAKAIRAELKALGLGREDVSVKSKDYSMGSSIDIDLKSYKGAKLYEKAQDIAKKSSKIFRCEATGEILGGGNTYVRAEIDWEFKREAQAALKPILDSMLPEVEEKGFAKNEALGIQLSKQRGEWVIFDIAKESHLQRCMSSHCYDHAVDTANRVLLESGRHPGFKGSEPTQSQVETPKGEPVLYKHSKTGADLWTVTLEEYTGRDQFKAILESAKAYGGSYSRAYKPAGFPGGFTFPTKEAAQSWIDGSEKTEGEADPANPNNKEKLEEMAEKLEEKAQEKLADRTENTPKQRRQASFARFEGYTMERAAKILRAAAQAEDCPRLTKADAMKAAERKLETGCGYYDCAFESNEWRDLSEKSQALRSLAGLAGDSPEEKAKKELERDLSELKNKSIPGFFPTPDSVIDRMLEIANPEEGDRILEPSCGIGSILDRIKGFDTYAMEINPTLAGICAKKGHKVENEDFMKLNLSEKFDLVLMNPPFENKQDVSHVLKAYDHLKGGGVVVAVMSAGIEFRNDAMTTHLRQMLTSCERLPSGSFKDAFNKTGVETCLVTIRK